MSVNVGSYCELERYNSPLSIDLNLQISTGENFIVNMTVAEIIHSLQFIQGGGWFAAYYTCRRRPIILAVDGGDEGLDRF